MNGNNSLTELSEQEQKELCFEIMSRCRFIPGFYDSVQNLLAITPSPFEEDKLVRTLKSEYKNCLC